MTYPTKRMASGALILNNAKQILVVKPHYLKGWLLPGGIVEENESPKAACIREVTEEIGLSLVIGRLLCLDYQGLRPNKSESLQFIFDGGYVSADQINDIKLQEAELLDYAFIDVINTEHYLGTQLGKRCAAAFKALELGEMVYLEHQLLV